MQVLCVKDEQGELRPMTGIWKDNPAGQINAEGYLAQPKNSDTTVVKAELTETIQNPNP